MEGIEIGKRINTILGNEIEVKELVQNSGNVCVYKVTHCEKMKYMKWYSQMENAKEVHREILSYVMNMKLGERFIFPQDITEYEDDSFGYIIESIPAEYDSAYDYICGKANFDSFKKVVDACINLVQAFRNIHLQGLTFENINLGDFWFDSANGQVLVQADDNISKIGMKSNIIATPGYVAPEVYIGKSNPDNLSDRFSMAVLVFMLLFKTHPLEGKRWAEAVVMTPQINERLYGTEPVFICDPTDKSNGPVPGLHKNLLNRWEYLPHHLKDIFVETFSKEAFSNPSRRSSEAEWMEQLCRFRSEVVPCSCGKSEIILIDGKSIKCDVCGRLFEIKHRIKLPEYDLPIVGGGRIYQCQIRTCSVEDALNPVASMLKKDEDTFGIKNETGDIWRCITPSGNIKQVGPDEVVPVKTGIKIDINGVELELE